MSTTKTPDAAPVAIAMLATGQLVHHLRIDPPLRRQHRRIVIASEPRPLPAIALAECLSTADVPARVVNLLTGFKSELVPVLASHLDVDALDVTGIDSSELEVGRAAAGNVKRIARAESSHSPTR